MKSSEDDIYLYILYTPASQPGFSPRNKKSIASVSDFLYLAFYTREIYTPSAPSHIMEHIEAGPSHTGVDQTLFAPERVDTVWTEAEEYSDDDDEVLNEFPPQRWDAMSSSQGSTSRRWSVAYDNVTVTVPPLRQLGTALQSNVRRMVRVEEEEEVKMYEYTRGVAGLRIHEEGGLHLGGLGRSEKPRPYGSGYYQGK